MTPEPTAITATSPAPARWRCGPIGDCVGVPPTWVLMARVSSCSNPLYPISGPRCAGDPSPGGREAAGAVVVGARRRLGGRLVAGRTAVAARTGPGHARHAPRQRRHEHDREREDDEARR